MEHLQPLNHQTCNKHRKIPLCLRLTCLDGLLQNPSPARTPSKMGFALPGEAIVSTAQELLLVRNSTLVRQSGLPLRHQRLSEAPMSAENQT